MPKLALACTTVGRLLLLVLEHDDGGIGGNIVLERVDVVHGDDGIDGIAAGDFLPKVGAVLVSHPAISADESQRAARLEQLEAMLDESDIHIRPTPHGPAGPPIGIHDRPRDVLQADVGGVADDVADAVQFMILKEKVLSADPFTGHGSRLVVGQPGHDQHVRDVLSRSLRVGLQKIEGANCRPKLAQVPAVETTGLDEPFDGWPEEGAGPAGGLDQDLGAEIPLG